MFQFILVMVLVVHKVLGNPVHTRNETNTTTVTVVDKNHVNFIDLTYDFANDTIVWPSFKNFEITSRVERTDGHGKWYSAQSFCSPEHAGTHIDAPSHFNREGWSIDQIPVDRFISPAIKVDIFHKVNDGDSDAQLTINDLIYWEEKYGRIPNGAIVLMYSGWGQHISNTTAYFGEDITNMTNTTEVTNFHFPGVHPEAAEWLAVNRTIYGMGVDTPSLDFGRSKDFLTHQILAESNIYGLENLKDLDKLPNIGSTIYVFPMKIRGGTGAPCRVLADINQVRFTSGISRIQRSSYGAITFLFATLVFTHTL